MGNIKLIIFAVIVVVIFAFSVPLLKNLDSENLNFEPYTYETETNNNQGRTYDIKSFDPVALFDEVQTYAGEDTELLAMVFDYVRPDGTIDLTAEYGLSENLYRFQRTTPTYVPQDKPLGAGGTLAGNQYEIIDIVIVDGRGSYSDYFLADESQNGMAKTTTYKSEPLPSIQKPSCNLAEVWQKAIENGAPASNAVANIDYNSAGYLFEIRASDYYFEMKLDFDCNLTSVRDHTANEGGVQIIIE